MNKKWKVKFLHADYLGMPADSYTVFIVEADEESRAIATAMGLYQDSCKWKVQSVEVEDAGW
tara:strand:- start:388 stop:573 length:186 start_codon:yes stop_codon:yes gene_type:complete